MNSEQEFAQSIYTIIKTFVDGPKTVSSLEAYFLSNQKAIKTMKDIDTSLYEKLINDFKEVKHAITSNGVRQGADDSSLEQSRETAVEQETLASRKKRTQQYREHHPSAGFWKG
jgi:hypothetical protein|tara:strand:- start:204 stop:545 length:342 start_codon:yes stop_codon:yes gene_type:complete